MSPHAVIQAVILTAGLGGMFALSLLPYLHEPRSEPERDEERTEGEPGTEDLPLAA